jgi:Leucine-rich repeat (LRR) protein
MIAQIVLVNLTAALVKSQALCPSVCQCSGENATCTDLFSDVTNMTQHRFHSGLRRKRVAGSTALEKEDDLFLRWNITSLTNLDLSRNNIRKIWQRAFYSLAELQYLNLYSNSRAKLDPKTFYNKTRLVWLSLSRNSITDLHPSTLQTNLRLQYIYIYIYIYIYSKPSYYAINSFREIIA